MDKQSFYLQISQERFEASGQLFELNLDQSCHPVCDLGHWSDSLLFDEWAKAWLLELGKKKLTQLKWGRLKHTWLMIKTYIDFSNLYTLSPLLLQWMLFNPVSSLNFLLPNRPYFCSGTPPQGVCLREGVGLIPAPEPPAWSKVILSPYQRLVKSGPIRCKQIFLWGGMEEDIFTLLKEFLKVALI